MTQPPIFILANAKEAADAAIAHERAAVLSTMTRWAEDMDRGRQSGTALRIRCIADLIRRGEHHRPIDTAPRRRMGR